MYWAAIRALDDGSNTERYAIAGYLLREVQEQLPRHLAVPQATPQMRLGDVFSWLSDRWTALLGVTGCRDGDGIWSGNVDRSLARFLTDLNKKIAQYRGDRPRWADVQRRTLGHLDPALAAVPAATQQDVVDDWLDCHDVFNAAAHHQQVDAERFEESVRAFEALLGERVVPRTFERQRQIEELVREAEGRANN